MKRSGLALLAVFLVGGVLPAAAAPPRPEIAREIQEGRRPMPQHLREYKENGPPRLRGDRQVRKVLGELKRRQRQDAGLDALPAPGVVAAGDPAVGVFPAAPPALGPANAIALLASFADLPPVEAPSYYNSLVFGFDGVQFGALVPSVSHYYREVSAGLFSITTENLPSSIACTPGVGPCTVATPPGWLPLPQTKADYQADLRAMLVDAIAASDDAVDYSRYDGDGDGLVDYLILVHAGSGGEYTGSNDDIWSQTLNVLPVPTADGVSIDTFITVPEYWFATEFGQMTIGVYAHEFGHLLGLPDLYDLSIASKGIGDWGLMGLGAWNGSGNRGESPAWMSAWSRVALGWVVPQVPASDLAGVVLAPVEQAGPVYYLWNHGGVNSEFFLIENRQKIAGTYDEHLPGSGLLIWHVDETMPGNNSAIPAADPARHQDCAWPNHYHVALQQADGFMNLEGNVNDGDIADPYPGSFGITSFSPTSTGEFPPRTPPNSGSYADCGSLVAVRNIVKLGDSIQLDLQVSGPPTGSIRIEGDAAYTSTTNVSLDLTASMDGGSGSGVMRFRNGSVGFWTGWEPFATPRSWTLVGGAGSKSVLVQFKDSYGVISDSDPLAAGFQGYKDTIILDPIAPTGSILIKKGAAATNSAAVILNLSAVDPGGSGVESMRFANDDGPWSGWEPYKLLKAWTMSGSAGIRTVLVQFRDRAGNLSDGDPGVAGLQGYRDTILLDLEAPTGSIRINGDDLATGDTAVTLHLSAADTGGSGMDSMQFANAGGAWSPWEPYGSTASWSLTGGGGTKAVFARFRDKAGNVSDSDPGTPWLQGYKDTILYTGP